MVTKVTIDEINNYYSMLDLDKDGYFLVADGLHSAGEKLHSWKPMAVKEENVCLPGICGFAIYKDRNELWCNRYDKPVKDVLTTDKKCLEGNWTLYDPFDKGDPQNTKCNVCGCQEKWKLSGKDNWVCRICHPPVSEHDVNTIFVSG